STCSTAPSFSRGRGLARCSARGRWWPVSGAPSLPAARASACSRARGARVAGARRAFTARVALDAVLLVLSRSGIARLLELHPRLHERAEALLARPVKAAVEER